MPVDYAHTALHHPGTVGQRHLLQSWHKVLARHHFGAVGAIVLYIHLVAVERQIAYIIRYHPRHLWQIDIILGGERHIRLLQRDKSAGLCRHSAQRVERFHISHRTREGHLERPIFGFYHSVTCAPRGELNRGLSHIIHSINPKRIIGIVVEIAIIAHAEKLHLHSIALHKTVAAIRLPVD